MNNLLIILFSLLLSAFFSGMEIAFISSNKLRIELDKKQGFSGSRVISTFTANPGQYIATMLVGNNIALVVYGIVMAILLKPFILTFTSSEPMILLIQTLISTLLILIAAEFLPKTLFRIYPNLALKIFAVPVYIFILLLFPVTRITILISNVILRTFTGSRITRQINPVVFGKVDIDHLVSEIPLEDIRESDTGHEIKIFQKALDFSNIKLRDCMVPRTEIVAFEENCQLEDLKQKFIESGYSKILIYRESTDNIIGFVNSKSFFLNPDQLKPLILNVPIVPETMPANKLLKLFIHEHKSIAVVVDEFGGTSGIVTLEDLIEEIFGEIEDEHDSSLLTEEKVSEQEYIFSGRHEIDYLNEKYQLGIPESDEYETLAGLILFHHESIPKINERIIIGRFTFRILDVSETRIELIKLILSDKE
jgi:CBS domain containing-hemolysin-like protein